MSVNYIIDFQVIKFALVQIIAYYWQEQLLVNKSNLSIVSFIFMIQLHLKG